MKVWAITEILAVALSWLIQKEPPKKTEKFSLSELSQMEVWDSGEQATSIQESEVTTGNGLTPISIHLDLERECQLTAAMLTQEVVQTRSTKTVKTPILWMV